MLHFWRRKTQKQNYVCRDFFFFYHFASLQNSVFRVSKLFFTHSHSSFQITIYKVSNLENKLIQWENTDKFETLKNSLRNIIKQMLQFWRRKSQKQQCLQRYFYFFTFCKLANLIFRSCKTFFCKILSFRTLSFNLSELYFQFWIMAG